MVYRSRASKPARRDEQGGEGREVEGRLKVVGIAREGKGGGEGDRNSRGRGVEKAGKGE